MTGYGRRLYNGTKVVKGKKLEKKLEQEEAYRWQMKWIDIQYKANIKAIENFGK